MIVLAGFLSACNITTDDMTATNDGLIVCHIGDDQQFAEQCVLEWQNDETFIIRHADGGFRRFTLLSKDKALQDRVIAVADGAEVLIVEEQGSGTVALTIGNNIYRVDTEIFGR